MKSVSDYWYSQNPIAWLLLPLSSLYCALVLVRRFLYRGGIIKSYQLPVPVIIVGNINVGGTGKTPLLISLCERIKTMGYKPGVISRGYGSSSKGERLLNVKDVASQVGDEPLLILERTGCPVAIGSNRIAAAQLLLAEHECDVLLSDDGLQHYRLRRDYEITVIDAHRLFGNGFCLPAGPLREPSSRFSATDLQVYNGLSNQQYSFFLKMANVINVKTGESKSIGEFAGETIHAIAGIGNPKRFFDQLSASGLTFTEHAFPDHYAYQEHDVTFDASDMVLMTEKDAVKCRGFSQLNTWYLPVNAELSDDLSHRLDADMARLLSQVSMDE